MAISIFLAKVFGLYMLVVSLTMLLRRERFLMNVNALFECRATMFFSAIMTLIMGILLVLAHNVWVLGWPVVITILCWLAFIKGVVRVAFPEWDDRWKGFYDNKNVTLTTGIIMLIIALFLLMMGFLA